MKKLEQNHSREAEMQKHICDTRKELCQTLFRFGDSVQIVDKNDLRENVGEHDETGLKINENKLGDEAVEWTDAITHEPHISIKPAA